MKKWFSLCCIVLGGVLSAALPEEVIRASAPGGLFLENEKIVFTNSGKTAFDFDVIAFPDENKCASGVIQPGEKLTLTQLPRGYYCLQDKKNADFSVRFAVVADPGKKPNNPDGFFALDAALSSLIPEKNEVTAIEIARRSGTRFIRERGPRFGRVEKEKDVIDYSAPLRRVSRFNNAGIKVLNMYHSAPAWSKADRPGNQIPDDLFALYNYSLRTAAKFKDRCPAYEFWNETDYKSPESAWDFVSALKAASLGYKAGDGKALMLNGGFAINPGEQKYHHVIMENGMAEYLDVLSVHCYGGISQYNGIMKRNYEFLDKHNANHLKIWYTETGCRAEGKGKVVFRDSKRMKEHSFNQEMLVSEFLVKQMTTTQFYGADRNFYFSLYPCNEENGAKVWGLTRLDTLQVKAGLVAFSTLINRFSWAKQLGKITGLPEKTSGFLYKQQDGSYTALVWTISQNDTRLHEENIAYDKDKIPFTLPGSRILAANSIFGTPLEVKNNTIQLGRLPVYLTIDKPLTVVTAENRKKAVRAVAKKDKTIVYQAIFAPGLEVGQEDGPWKSRPSQIARFTADRAKIKLYVYNFSNKEKRGFIQLIGCRAAGFPDKEFTLEPMSKKLFLVELAPQTKQGKITVSGKFNGLPTTKLVIPFAAGKISDAPMSILLPDTPEGWNRMASGSCSISADRANWALQVKTVFGEKTKDKWCYPFIRPNVSDHKNGKLTFEIAIDSDFKDLTARTLITYGNDAKQDALLVLPQQQGVFKRQTITLSRKPGTEKIVRIAIGANSKAKELQYRIRDIKIIPGK